MVVKVAPLNESAIAFTSVRETIRSLPPATTSAINLETLRRFLRHLRKSAVA